MVKHEAKLIDPGADAVVAALTATTAGANKRCRARLLADDPAKWRKFARDAAAEPEGYAMFRGGKGGVPATQVLAAWWTDAAGRKHVVIRGRRVEHDEAKRLLKLDELQTRIPLWHAYPEYVCRRFAGKSDEIVCACGCGAVGTPRALAWMGETCGPCHDRKEELGAAGLRANLPGVLYGHREPLGAVACSPDGTRVVAVEGGNCVTCWDIPARTRTVITLLGPGVTDAAITTDGRYLLVVGANTMVAHGLFAVFDLTTDPPTRLEHALDADPSALRVVPLEDPGLAVLHRWTPAGVNRAEVVRVPSGEVVCGADLPHNSGLSTSACVFGAEVVTTSASDTLAQVFDTRTMRPVRDFPIDRPPLAAFSHDGARLIVAHPRPVYAYDAATGAPVARGGLPTSGLVPFDEGLTALAVDPAGEFVYAGSRAGRVYAFAADTLKLRAALDWHLGAVAGLAVSADGARLFSSGGDGCVKVWPIRDLLRGA